MSTQASTRNDFIDSLKGALIFLVVCGHLIQFVGYGDNLRFYLDPLFKAIYTFHMPLFMAVSGFVSFHSISTTDFLPCIQKRFRQIIVPAVCWPALGLMADLLVCLIRQDTLTDGLHFFIKSLAAFRPGFWFLWALFGSTVVVSTLKKFGRDRLEFFAGATLVFLFAPDGADIYLFKYTFPFFCIGYALAKGDQIHVPKVLSLVLVTATLAAAIGCYLLWNTDTYVYTTRMHPAYSNLPNISLRYFSGAAVSAAFVFLALGCYRIVKSRTLSNWGRHSLDIYIIHTYFLAGLAALDNPLKNSLWFSFVAAPFLAGILCTVTCQIGRGIRSLPVARTLLLGQT
jgi:fucose 4-O-acetylase-like acetyltransferase